MKPDSNPHPGDPRELKGIVSDRQLLCVRHFSLALYLDLLQGVLEPFQIGHVARCG